MSANSKGFPKLPWVPMALAGAGGLALLDALAIEPNRLRVVRVDLPVGGHADRLAGLRIAHLSDLHVGGLGWRRGTATRAIDACNQEDVDLVAITGDLIGSGSGVQGALELLSSLRSDVPRVAVLGNHDHVHGKKPLDALLEGLRTLGIRLLRNQAVCIELRSRRVWLAGVDDGYSMRDDLELALGSLSPDGFPRLLLTHYPDVADQLRPGQVQLSLAGHTHAGQIRLPVLTQRVNGGHARTKYPHGLFLVNGNPLYVTGGVGMSGLPMRFRNWPELAILRLLSAVGQRPWGTGRPSSVVGTR